VTHPDLAPETRLSEVIVIDKEELVYKVGSHEEIEIQLTIVEIFGSDHGHVIKHPCREIKISVDYAGHTAELVAHPADPVKDVRTRAIDLLKVDASTAADLVLRLAGEAEDLTATAPIGAYVARGSCAVLLDLVHIVRPQG
jgi:hypothetical protein